MKKNKNSISRLHQKYKFINTFGYIFIIIATSTGIVLATQVDKGIGVITISILAFILVLYLARSDSILALLQKQADRAQNIRNVIEKLASGERMNLSELKILDQAEDTVKEYAAAGSTVSVEWVLHNMLSELTGEPNIYQDQFTANDHEDIVTEVITDNQQDKKMYNH